MATQPGLGEALSGERLWARTELPQPSQAGTDGFCAWKSERMPEGCVSKGLNKQQALPKIFISCYMHVAVALRKGGCDRGGGKYLIFSPSCSEILFSSLAHKDFTGMGNKRCPVEMMLLAVPYRTFILGCFSLSYSSLSRAKSGYTNHPFSFNI